jgi:hypothetical protein
MKIMKTKLLKKFAILSLGLMGLFFIGNNVYASINPPSQATKCDLCVVKKGGEVKYSCEPKDSVSCSDTHWSGVSVYCNNAKEC